MFLNFFSFKLFALCFLSTFGVESWRPNTYFSCSTSIFQHQKLEAQQKKNNSVSHGALELHAWGIYHMPNKKKFCLTSNFWHQNLEAEQKTFFKLSSKAKLPSSELPKVQKFPQINFLNAIIDSYLTFFTSFLYFAELFWNKESMHRGILDYFIFTLCFQITHLTFFLI
jgi:hypothetical protein